MKKMGMWKFERIELIMIVWSVNDENVKILMWIVVLKMKMSIVNESKGERMLFWWN